MTTGGLGRGVRFARALDEEMFSPRLIDDADGRTGKRETRQIVRTHACMDGNEIWKAGLLLSVSCI